MLVAGVALRDPRVGDLHRRARDRRLLLHDANNYNGARRPPVVFVRDGDARVVVRREGFEDLLRLDA